ncbi:MAG TPA: sigma-70 family RNA polymerase sigma factor [Burkholderiales bacterium]|jgi:RNA polymerase sigma-70 factor (ECF subfamily)|nr:sigma-70 family RNA polymerase sigma factor [Burkholderiales bacterium]
MPADFRSQIEGQRAYLLRFAMLQLRNSESAEDVVQETLLAALAGESSYRGQANLRTWLTGILKHKIVDAIRKSTREVAAGAFDDDPDIESLGYKFKDNGHWAERPAAWADPDSALERKEFLAALEKCLAALPPRTAQAFLLREHLGLETQEICKELKVTATHCWVLLYRARMALRQCLEAGWFGKDAKGG